MTRLLMWLDTHVVHHRWEWHPLNRPLRALLKRAICDPFEAKLLTSAELNMTEEEFDVLAAKGEPVEVVVPNGFRCNHMSVSIGGARWTAVPEFGCGCKPQPVFQ